MIRPLEYCETPVHVLESLDTIAYRIEELRNLRELYLAKYRELNNVQTIKNLNPDLIEQDIMSKAYTSATGH